MGFAAIKETIPLVENSQGVLKVSGTRITLDTIVYAFLEGATAEEILLQYPSLKLADVYFVIGYFLQNRKHVEEYLLKREQERHKVRIQNESHLALKNIRDRLLARHKEGKHGASVCS